MQAINSMIFVGILLNEDLGRMGQGIGVKSGYRLQDEISSPCFYCSSTVRTCIRIQTLDRKPFRVFCITDMLLIRRGMSLFCSKKKYVLTKESLKLNST